MADIEYRGMMHMPQDTVQYAGQSRKATKFVNAMGALMSVSLIAGTAVWGYKLMVRDVFGVPVVRALDGPMRVQPDDPGGEQTAHQGLSVNRVQAEGLTEPVADRLVLAPVGPDVGEGDQAGLTRPVPAPREGVSPIAEAADVANIAKGLDEIVAPVLLTETLPMPSLPATVSDGEGQIVASADAALSEPSATDSAVAEALALAELIAGTATPLSDLEEVTQRVPVAIIPASIKGVSRSPRPIIRPAGLVVASATTSVEVAAARVFATSSPEVDPATITPGTRLAQLGAFDSAEVAGQEWDRLYSRFAEYMEGKSRVIQKAERGGRTFYRLRAMGFDDLSDARRFCSALLAEDAACIPVKVR